MHAFRYQGGELYCERVPLRVIVREVGTPCYVYSEATLRHHCRVMREAFSDVPSLICYAVKANPSLSLLRILAQEGCGADVVSGGELFRALQAGIPPQRIVFAGVGKQIHEMEEALEAGIRMFNVESEEELETLHQVAQRRGVVAPVALRVNPDVDPQTHPYIATGLRKTKFGLDPERALMAYRKAARLSHIRVVGIHKHIGSQILEVTPFVDALRRILHLVERLQQEGIPIQNLDVGGGLGIPYRDETPPHPRELGEALVPLVRDRDCTLILEPGRVLVGSAGVLVTRVLYRKKTPEKEFLIVDAGMNDFLRPSLYQAYHEIQPVVEKAGEEAIVDVVGPVCESGDFLGRGRRLPRLQPGDLLVVMGAGAYGFAMASNYNSRPRPPEVLVAGDRFFVIRRRECYQDLIRGETIPEHLVS